MALAPHTNKRTRKTHFQQAASKAKQAGKQRAMATSAVQLADLGRKIFQRLPQRQIASGNKVISKQLKGDKVVQWFNKPLALRLGGDDPNFEILNSERLGKLDQMKRRGKSIPKKGAGKRSGKK